MKRFSHYDGYGNLESKVSYPYTTGEVGEATDTVSYTYSDNSWKDKLTNFNGQDISYDAIGNPVSYRGADCTYFGRQLQSYTTDSMTVSYEYDGNGLRESKIVDGIQHDYYYIDNVLMYEKSGNNYELFYRYDNNGRLSMITRYSYSNNSFAYYNVVTNTQGDVIAILNGAGSNVVNHTYDTFGKIVSIKNANGSVITSASNIGIQNSIRYRGYVYDSETNLYYLQSRYYDPDTGRFINCDDPEFIGVNDTFTGWNGFAYCENDWVNDTDPSGNVSVKDFFDVLIKAVDSMEKVVKYIAQSYTRDLQKLNNTLVLLTKKELRQKKYIKKLIAECNDLSRRLNKTGKLISAIVIVVSIVSKLNNTYEWSKELITFLVSKSIELLCTGITKIITSLSKSIPGVGFLLGVMSSIVAEVIMMSYFTEERISSITYRFVRSYKLVAKTHRLAYGMKATFFDLTLT